MKTCSPGRLGLRAICRDESWTHERKQEFWGRNCRVKKGREPRTEPWRLRRVGNRGSRKGMVKGKERTVVLLMRAHVCRTRSWWGKAARDPGALKPGPVCCGSVRWGGGRCDYLPQALRQRAANGFFPFSSLITCWPAPGLSPVNLFPPSKESCLQKMCFIVQEVCWESDWPQRKPALPPYLPWQGTSVLKYHLPISKCQKS